MLHSNHKDKRWSGESFICQVFTRCCVEIISSIKSDTSWLVFKLHFSWMDCIFIKPQQSSFEGRNGFLSKYNSVNWHCNVSKFLFGIKTKQTTVEARRQTAETFFIACQQDSIPWKMHVHVLKRKYLANKVSTILHLFMVSAAVQTPFWTMEQGND